MKYVWVVSYDWFSQEFKGMVHDSIKVFSTRAKADAFVRECPDMIYFDLGEYEVDDPEDIA